MRKFLILQILLVTCTHTKHITLNGLSYDLYENLQPTFSSQNFTQQSLIVETIYVNKESKEINFGLSPIPKLLKSPRSNAISEDEFHHTISSYFYSFRDIHHQYTYPRPYSCYSVIFPLSFDIAENRIVIVTDFSPGYPIAREFNPGLKSIVKKGDVLVSINGKSIDDLYQEHQLKTGGANYYGGITSLLNYFTLRHGSFYQLPEETDITYGLVRGSKSFEITLNIVGARDNYCIKKHLNIDSMVPELINSFKSKDENQDQEIKSSISRKRKSKSDEEEIQDQENNSPKKQKSKSDQIKSRKRKRLEFKHAAAQPSKNARGSTSFWKKTKDPFLSYREYKYKNSKMLIIKLLDFSPLKDNVQNALEKIYNLIIKYAFVDSILFDLRDNPGGQISLAEGIFQFFKLDAKLSLARALVTPLNKLLMASDHGDERWFEAISNSRGKYTNQIPYFNDRFVNHYGMIFLKPVGVLVNSACYSSCDMFTAGFQDNEIGVVYGTEPQTGGGGANVITLADLIDDLPNEFVALDRGQTIQTSYRQSVRIGKNHGKLLEDYGVFVDKVFAPTVEDILYKKEERSTLFDRIAVDLINAGKSTKRDNMTSEPHNLVTLLSNDFPVINVESSKLNKLDLLYNGKIVFSVNLRGSKMIERSLLIDKSQDQTPGVKKYTINGYQDESLIVRANRYFRYIPKNIMKIVPGHLFVWDYLYQPFMHIFNRNDETKSGWNIIDGKMVIGNGETYDDEIESTISFFLEIPSTLNPRLKIKALLDSEKNCDFLSVSVGKIQGNQERLYTISGRNVTIEKEFELKRFAGIGRVEVQVSFTSDEMIHHGQIRLLDLVFVS